MIEFNPKIKNDLASNVSNLQYLLKIETTPPVLIGSQKTNIETGQEVTTINQYGENFFPQPFYEQTWLTLSTNNIEDQNVLFNSNLIYTSNGGVEAGKKYKVVFDISGLPQPTGAPPPSFMLGYNWGLEEYIGYEDGVYEFELETIDDNTNYYNIYFLNCNGATLHSISIQEQETTQIQEPLFQYYQDTNLKVANLTEKIDLKTKKVQYGDMTFTLSNSFENNKYMSDNLRNAIGSDITLYLKTQSCRTLEDCAIVSKLKIRKMEHDNKTIKITANDKSLEGLYKQIPSTVLKKDINTNDANDLKPVPILYGHMENAPAVLYTGDGGYKLLPDDSYFSDNKNIEGVKKFYLPNSRSVDYMISPNLLKVALGSTMCDVPCLPYNNNAYREGALHQEPTAIRFEHNQYFLHQDHISLNNQSYYNKNVPILENYNALWISKVVDAKKSKDFTYHYFGNDDGQSGVLRESLLRLISGYRYGDDNFYFFGNPEGADVYDDTETWAAGFQIYTFEPINGANLLENEKIINNEDDEPISYKFFPIDTHFIGSMDVEAESISTIFSQGLYPRIGIGFFVIKDDETNDFNLLNGNTFGSPSEYQITNDSSNASDSFATKTWNTQTIDLTRYTTVSKYYITNFMSIFNENTEGGGNYWESSYNNKNLQKDLGSNTMALMYSCRMTQNIGALDNTPNTALSITNNEKNMQVRKTWANKEILNKDFFVNAKGRVDEDIEYTNINHVRGNIKVLTKEEITFVGATTGGAHRSTIEYDNIHQIELYKLLTDKKYKTKIINGELYELMIRYDGYTLGASYLWDIEVNNLDATLDVSGVGGVEAILIDEQTPFRTSMQGWDYFINAKNYNLGKEYGDFYLFENMDLVYGKINMENENTLDNIEVASIEDSLELQDFNNNKGWNDIAEGLTQGYAHVIWEQGNTQPAYKLCDTAPYIVKNLLTKEMGVNEVDNSKLQKAGEATKNNKMAFSITEQEDTRTIIEEVCNQSRLTFRFRPSDGLAVMDAIYDTYDVEQDIDKELDLKDTLSYKFEKTKIEDLCIGGVKVKYGESTGEQKEELITMNPDLIDQYIEKYGVLDVEDYVLETTAPFITDKASALEYGNYLFNYYKNQHLIIKMTLLTKDGFDLEVGDVLKINSDRNAFSLNISEETELIDQTVYPMFYITKVDKNTSRVNIECVQLHKLR